MDSVDQKQQDLLNIALDKSPLKRNTSWYYNILYIKTII